MIQGNRIIVVVPARGGSKGIKLKNLKKLNGESLIALVGDVVAQLEYIDRAIVSTDHPKISTIAKASGLDVPFIRPDILSGDLVSDVEVLTHALYEVEKIDKIKYDIIIMLQPTSPFRKPEHITLVVKKLIKFNYDSVLTISETDSKAHPLKQLNFDEDKISYYDSEGAKIIARQQLKPTFHRNGVAYAIRRKCLIEQKTTIGINASAVVIPGIMVNIDTDHDYKFAQYILKD